MGRVFDLAPVVHPWIAVRLRSRHAASVSALLAMTKRKTTSLRAKRSNPGASYWRPHRPTRWSTPGVPFDAAPTARSRRRTPVPLGMSVKTFHSTLNGHGP